MPGLDKAEYGSLLISLRYRRGYKSGTKFAAAITAIGTPLTNDALWAIERGEREASVGRHLAFCELLKPLPGYFEEAYDAGEQTDSGQ